MVLTSAIPTRPVCSVQARRSYGPGENSIALAAPPTSRSKGEGLVTIPRIISDHVPDDGLDVVSTATKDCLSEIVATSKTEIIPY